MPLQNLGMGWIGRSLKEHIPPLPWAGTPSPIPLFLSGVGTSCVAFAWVLALFLSEGFPVVSVHLSIHPCVSPQPVTTACGLWRRRRRTPSACWGRALWCCLTPSSAASGKTCTSSVPAARYNSVLLLASLSPFQPARLLCCLPFRAMGLCWSGEGAQPARLDPGAPFPVPSL